MSRVCALSRPVPISTIDFLQSSFWEFLEAISLSTALTSTLAGAGAPPEDAVDAEPAGATEEEAAAPAPGVEGPEDEAEAGAFPKIFDIKVLNMFISRSYADSTKTKGYSGTRAGNRGARIALF
jgi:hypothetical protein